MFGAAWPAIYQQWHLPVYFGSFITSIIYFSTMISSLVSTKMIERFGTGRVSAFSTALTAIAMLGFAMSLDYWMLCVWAIPLGLGAGSIDTALNNYVANNYSVRQMNYLHCFYGIGIVVSPYILSNIIHGTDGWSDGYLIIACIQSLIALLLYSTLSLWNNRANVYTDFDSEYIPLRRLIKMKKVRLMWAFFVTSCTIETSCACYGCSFLVEQKNLSVESAALIILSYFSGIAIGRFISGNIADKIGVWKTIMYCETILGAGLVMLILGGNTVFIGIGLLFIGLGNGPLFPNLNYLTPIIFGKKISSSVIGSQMAVASVTGITTPILCGFFGMKLFPFFLLAFFAWMLAITPKANCEFIKNQAF